MLHYSVESKILMEKSSNKLVDLSIAFAVKMLNLVKYPKEQRETIICNQIGRANETSYWLLLLGKTKILSSAEYDWLETLCREIRITLIASINTTKQNLK